MDKAEIVRALNWMADLMELQSENPFRPRSFRSGARAIEALTEDLAEVIEADRLGSIRGVGKTLVEEIRELIREIGGLDNVIHAEVV